MTALRAVGTTGAGAPSEGEAHSSPIPADHPSSDAARLRRLVEAQAVINSDLALGDMLDRIIRTACELVGARYGALGVIGPDGSLEQLIHFGMDAATVSGIGALPVARHGLLGAMIGEPTAVRVDDIATDHRSAGFPARHPKMGSFLGVPIRVRGAVFGDIYLAEAAAGRFTAADEELVSALAATAGIAIANARLYEEAQRSRDWLHASGEVARALLADADVDMLLEVVSGALDVAEADSAALVLPTADGHRLAVTVCVGLGSDHYSGLEFDPVTTGLGRLVGLGESVLVPDFTAIAEDGFGNDEAYGPMMLAPLVDARGVRGAVLMLRTRSHPQFTSADLELVTAFADQVTLALELDDARTDAEWLRVLEVRHRLAEDLHDNVIQRLFATGMGLHRIADADLPADVAERLARYVGDLDETIDEIRERIFGLRQDAHPRDRIQGRFPPLAPGRPSDS
jgi:GAF domain-containing protein